MSNRIHVFDLNRYGPTIAGLLTPPRVAALGPGSPNQVLYDRLKQLELTRDFPEPITDHEMARACHSGLWLYHDFLDESHTISQELHGSEGSFWHAIMHRREPDAWNSKYWWRQVGTHPVFDQLCAQSAQFGYRYTTPFDFVDFCEQSRGTGSANEELAKQVQQLEWQLLFEHCYQKAIG